MKSRFVPAFVLLVSSVSSAAIAQTTETSTPTTDATATVQEESGAPAPSSDGQQGDLVATTPAAEASADAAAEAGGIEDIVVTATRREERLQDVPVAVTAITNSTLSAAGVGGLRDLTVVVPGFQGGRNATVNQPTIRGVGSSGIGMADESNVATYVDGVYQPFSFTSALDLVEIERVEVLRGPQGTVFGRNATGGLINVITPDPSFNTRGRIEARVGRMRNDATEVDLRTYLTTGLTDTLAIDFAGLYKENDGYIKDLVRGGTLGDSRSINLRSKLLFQPNDDVRIVLTGNYVELDSSQNTVIPYKNNTAGRRYPGYIAPQNPWQASVTDVPHSDYERYSVALHTQFDLGGVSLQTTSGYVQNDIYQFTDSDGSNIFLGQIPFDTTGESYSQEVRLLSTGPGRFKWILGAYAFHLDTEWNNIRLQNSTPGNPVTVTRLDPQAKTTSFAGFGEGTFEVVDNLFLTGGVRYTTEKRKFNTALNLNPLPFGTAEKTSNKWTYRGALRYNFSDRGNVYVSYGTGFKSGVFNELGLTPTATDPETIKAWEGGVKVDPLPWLRTNLSVYHYDYKDLQVQARAANGISYILQNAANAEIYGGELEVTAAVTDDLNLRGAFTYTHGEYSEFPNAQTFVPLPTGGNQVIANDVSGNKVIRAPRHTFSGGFDWGTDLAGGRFGATANLYHSARVYYDFLNLASQKPYTTASGEISWTTPNEAWRFSLWAKNITNEAVVQTLRPGVLGTDAIYDRPREIGVGATFRF